MPADAGPSSLPQFFRVQGRTPRRCHCFSFNLFHCSVQAALWRLSSNVKLASDFFFVCQCHVYFTLIRLEKVIKGSLVLLLDLRQPSPSHHGLPRYSVTSESRRKRRARDILRRATAPLTPASAVMWGLPRALGLCPRAPSAAYPSLRLRAVVRPAPAAPGCSCASCGARSPSPHGPRLAPPLTSMAATAWVREGKAVSEMTGGRPPLLQGNAARRFARPHRSGAAAETRKESSNMEINGAAKVLFYPLSLF